VNGAIFQNQADLYRLSSWVYSAVSRVAQFAAACHLDVYELAGKREQEVDNHPFELVLGRPNPLMSRFELLEATFSFLKLNGNAFWWLNQVNNNPPVEIFSIEPWRMTIIPDEKSAVRGYYYDPGDGEQLLLEASTVVHFKGFNPNTVFMGMSDIEPLAVAASTDMAQQSWNNKMFGKNNGRLPGILAFADAINDTDWDKLKLEAASSAEARELMMLRNVGKGGVQWQQAASTLKDMEFTIGRAFTKEEIYSVLAPGLASVLAVNATEATAKAGFETLTRMAIWPMLCAVHEKITNDILPWYGKNLRAVFEDVRLKDRALELQERTLFAQVHTIDEIRDIYDGDDPVGDVRGNLFPAEINPRSSQLLVPTTPPEQGQGQQMAGELAKTGVRKAEKEPIPVPSLKGREEMAAWRKKALKAVQAGKEADVPFETEVIPLSVCDRIHTGLKALDTTGISTGVRGPQEVRKVFEEAAIGEKAIGQSGSEIASSQSLLAMTGTEGARGAPQQDIAGLVKALERAAAALKWGRYP
jgi:HK97 family phage portal protein